MSEVAGPSKLLNTFDWVCDGCAMTWAIPTTRVKNMDAEIATIYEKQMELLRLKVLNGEDFLGE